ncbi:MAG: hypothetical protein HQK57_00925 [Deltaproteobacteria bacterium]|nr:hypothetical protein [Deltaproteobacteria bacterium]
MSSIIKKIYKKGLPDAAISFVVTTIDSLLARETVRSSLRAQLRRLLTGSREKPYREISTVELWADKVMKILNDKGVSAKTIGIDGLPGSGKSSLGRALAARSGLTWRTLYWRELINAFPFESGYIYENIRLIRCQDIDRLEVVIYIDCPIEDAASRVLERDRGGILADLFDFPKLKEIGDVAFETIDGEEIRITGSPIRIKLRPKGGYRDIKKLRDMIKNKETDLDLLCKEEMLFTYCYGRPQKGIWPYIKLDAYNPDILSGVSAAFKKALVSLYFT